MNKYICVSGNMAVGKTTLVQLLCSNESWKPIYESIGSHPYIHDFYSEPHRWAFHNQLYFLVESLRIQVALRESNQGYDVDCQDFSVYERHLYTEMLFEQGKMNERDYATCSEFFRLVLETGRQPDCIVYLRANPPTIIKRLVNRGRQAESKVDIELIENLANRYDKWFLNRLDTSVLVVDTEELDLRDGREVENLKGRITAAVAC